MKHRFVFFGTSPFGIPCLEAFIANPNFELQAIVTQPDRPQNRGQAMQPTAIGTWAAKHQIALIKPEKLTPNVIDEIKQYQADFFLIIAYGLILPPAVLGLTKRGCVNVHASLLPKYRGATPIPATLLNDDSETGISIMLMDEGIDTGPILAQFKVPLHGKETAPEVSTSLAALAGQHITETLTAWLAGTLQAQPQSPSSTPYAKRLQKIDGFADWSSGRMIERKIRALQPWPGVWTVWNEHVVKLLAASYIAGQPTERPGTVVNHDREWGIACGDGWLIPSQVQFAGRKPQLAASVPGGYPGFIGSSMADRLPA